MIRRPFAALLALAVLAGPAPASSAAARVSTVPRLSLDVRNAELLDVLRLLATQSGRNVVADQSVKSEHVTLHLENVTFDQALSVIVHANDLQVRRETGALIVGTSASMNRKYGDENGRLASRTAVIATHNARPDDLVKPLTDALPAGTVIVADKRTGSVVVTGAATTVQRARRLISALDASSLAYTPTAVIPLRYSRSFDAVKQLSGVLPSGSYVADDHQNAIIVNGTNETVTTARRMLAAIDVPTPQVMFEVKVVDVTLNNDQSNVGVLFGGKSENGGPNSVTFGPPGQTGYFFLNNTIPIAAQLNFAVVQGRAKVLATPRLATLNNQEATLSIATQYPIVQSVATTSSTTSSVQYVDIGVKLRMTPTIGSDGSIIAEIHPEYSTLLGVITAAAAPEIATRKLDATLRVRPDQTIVIGGLLSDQTSETITKVPILGDIPILGEVFRNRQKTHIKDDVVFMITPRVVQ